MNLPPHQTQVRDRAQRRGVGAARRAPTPPRRSRTDTGSCMIALRATWCGSCRPRNTAGTPVVTGYPWYLKNTLWKDLLFKKHTFSTVWISKTDRFTVRISKTERIATFLSRNFFCRVILKWLQSLLMNNELLLQSRDSMREEALSRMELIILLTTSLIGSGMSPFSWLEPETRSSRLSLMEDLTAMFGRFSQRFLETSRTTGDSLSLSKSLANWSAVQDLTDYICKLSSACLSHGALERSWTSSRTLQEQKDVDGELARLGETMNGALTTALMTLSASRVRVRSSEVSSRQSQQWQSLSKRQSLLFQRVQTLVLRTSPKSIPKQSSSGTEDWMSCTEPFQRAADLTSNLTCATSQAIAAQANQRSPESYAFSIITGRETNPLPTSRSPTAKYLRLDLSTDTTVNPTSSSMTSALATGSSSGASSANYWTATSTSSTSKEANAALMPNASSSPASRCLPMPSVVLATTSDALSTNSFADSLRSATAEKETVSSFYLGSSTRPPPLESPPLTSIQASSWTSPSFPTVIPSLDVWETMQGAQEMSEDYWERFLN